MRCEEVAAEPRDDFGRRRFYLPVGGIALVVLALSVGSAVHGGNSGVQLPWTGLTLGWRRHGAQDFSQTEVGVDGEDDEPQPSPRGVRLELEAGKRGSADFAGKTRATHRARDADAGECEQGSVEGRAAWRQRAQEHYRGAAHACNKGRLRRK